MLLQQLRPDKLCVPQPLQDVLLRRLKAEVMGQLPPKRRQVGPQALCSSPLNDTPDMWVLAGTCLCSPACHAAWQLLWCEQAGTACWGSHCCEGVRRSRSAPCCYSCF